RCKPVPPSRRCGASQANTWTFSQRAAMARYGASGGTTRGWRPEGWLLIHAEIKMQPGATATAVWREPGKHLDLFATGSDGAVWSISWNNTVGWRPEGRALIRADIKTVPGVSVFAG